MPPKRKRPGNVHSAGRVPTLNKKEWSWEDQMKYKREMKKDPKDR
jgi:hypothetical protein